MICLFHLQILGIQSEDGRKSLIFIPLAPACVVCKRFLMGLSEDPLDFHLPAYVELDLILVFQVIRVLTPLYATVIPHRPLPWRLLWTAVWFALTYAVLVICKMAVGLALTHLAGWYLRRHSDRKAHAD